MTYSAKIIADSITADVKRACVRLTTMEVVFPRIVLAEFNTHRMLSRNSASSRAIPVEKRITAVRAEPFVPELFGRNQKGMQAGSNLDAQEARKASEIWLQASLDACARAEQLSKIGVHKQLANRLIEPFGWHTVVVTATEWENYFALRCSRLAQPEIRIVSELMEEAYKASTPIEKRAGDWHLPYVTDDDVEVFSGLVAGETAPEMKLAEISTARCARVSYLTHDGSRDVVADFRLHDTLLAGHHMSPLEHPAFVEDDEEDTRDFIGNFRAPWHQYRKLIPFEAVAPREK